MRSPTVWIFLSAVSDESLKAASGASTGTDIWFTAGGSWCRNLLWVPWRKEYILPLFGKWESFFRKFCRYCRWPRVHLTQIELRPYFRDSNPQSGLLVQKLWGWRYVGREIYRWGRAKRGTVWNTVSIFPIIFPSFGSLFSDAISNGSPRKQKIIRDARFFVTL